MGTCLVTGGAGFIGTALSHLLPGQFDRVVAVDNLHPQVHPTAQRPAALDDRVELVVADVTDPSIWTPILQELRPQVIVHLAAETGTGQSLTEASRHGLVNVVGTTRLLDALSALGQRPERIVLTSSRAVYGEGAWQDSRGVVSYPGQRSRAMLEAGIWDFPGLAPLPFEAVHTRAAPTSVYGATKLAQEHLVAAWCLAMGVRPVLYRLQNVYGPGQSLTNPYTGIVSLFAQLAKAGKVIPVYEDGQIVRDFVYIDDVARAVFAGAVDAPGGTVPYDIGSGRAVTVQYLAELAASRYGAPGPQINGLFRDGDVRHAECDIERSAQALTWSPTIPVEHGLARLCAWIDGT